MVCAVYPVQTRSALLHNHAAVSQACPQGLAWGLFDMKAKVLALCGVVMAAGIASPAAANPPLRETAIDDGLLAVGLADQIRKSCPEISARMFVAVRYVMGLRQQARDLGYSDADITAYRRSDAEKARLRAKGAAYLAANGVVENRPETYCALGREEIENESQIGALLRAN